MIPGRTAGTEPSDETRDRRDHSRGRDSQPRFAMSDSMIIDIALGLLLFFLVLSLICSAVQEWIASVFGLRSRNLRKGIDNLLGAEIAKSFYNHGLLKSLYRGPGVFGLLKFERGAGPSYIEPRLFADVLVDVIDRGAGSGAARRNDATAKTVKEIENAITNIKQEDVREALLTLLADAKTDTNAFRQKAADWFDAAMDRVSGWYARTVKIWLFVIATAVVVLFNADAIQIAKKLWEDEALRASLAAVAQKTVADREQVAGKPETGDGQGTDTLPTPAKALATLEEFPIGWECRREPGSPDCTAFRGLQSVVGWLVSIIACSFGAPFWFGLLSKVVSLRGSGKTPIKPAQGTAQT
jgi:hypothetical protein